MTRTTTMTSFSRLTTLLPLALHFLSFSPDNVDATTTSTTTTSFGKKCAPAFIVSSPSLSRSRRSAAPLFPTALQYYGLNDGDNNGEDNDDDHGDNGITRRDLFRSTTGSIIGAASLANVKPSSARAAMTTTTEEASSATKTSSTPSSSMVPNTLCDPSVSTWVKTDESSDGGAAMRTVHILGTAHISSSSAELAGQMVRDLKPNVVFVELDAKRVARAIPGGIEGGNSSSANGGGSTNSALATNDASSSTDGKEPTTTTTATSPTSTAAPTKSSSSVTSTPDNTIPQKSNPFDVQSKLVNVGSKYVGNAVKGMYGKLESEGFKAGDEFAMSVREGLAIGSTIVLGDRDVEVTLRRLTRALAKTDIRKLLSADSEVNSSMESLLPEGMKESLKQSSSNDGGGGSSSTMSVQDVAVDKGEFQTFVETMKAKENVKKIMRGLQSTAPEIYEAMVAERDIYMGRGLDEMGANLKDKSVENTVAVMGMAHVDGVERYLASKGWKEMTYPCPVMR